MIGQNLKKIRKSKGITQQKLASDFNVAIGTISMWESDKRDPDSYTIAKLAKYFGVSVDYLLGIDDFINEFGEDKFKLLENKADNYLKRAKIPVLGTIPAGIPIEAIEEILDYEEISEDMASRGEFFALKVKGDSMLPTIKDGDVVIVRQQDDCESGQICVVMINGFDATLKEIKKDPQGVWVLPHNSNCDFKPTFFSNKEVDEVPVRIIGVAVEIRRSL